MSVRFRPVPCDDHGLPINLIQSRMNIVNPLSPHIRSFRHSFYSFLVTIVLLIFCSSSYLKNNFVIFILLISKVGMNLDLIWLLGDFVGGDVNEAGSMLVFMYRDDINLDLSLAPPMVDEQGAPPVVEEPLQPPVIADVFPEGGG